MNAGGFVVAILLFGLCVYAFDGCLRGFRRSRNARSKQHYLYGVGIAITLVVLLVLLVGLLLTVIGPLH